MENPVKEHLTPEELLEALKYCRGQLGGQGCEGCPNAVPGTQDKYGLCQCRFDTTKEVIHLLESIVKK